MYYKRHHQRLWTLGGGDVNSGEQFELQPDGNPFDIFKGFWYIKECLVSQPFENQNHYTKNITK